MGLVTEDPEEFGPRGLAYAVMALLMADDLQAVG